MPPPRARKYDKGFYDEVDLLIGVLEGCEWKPGEIAERLDRTTEAVRLRRTGRHRPLIELLSAWVQEGIQKRVAIRFAAADAKRRVNEKGWRLLEALLDRAETDAQGQTTLILDALALGALKEAFDRTEGKSLDRKAILSQHTEIHQQERLLGDDTVEIDGNDLDGILEETLQLNTLRRRALGPAPEAMEAELVDKSELQTQ